MWLLLILFQGTLGMNVKTKCMKSPWEYFCHDGLYVTRYIKNSPFRFDICIFTIYKISTSIFGWVYFEDGSLLQGSRWDDVTPEANLCLDFKFLGIGRVYQVRPHLAETYHTQESTVFLLIKYLEDEKV